MSSITQFEACEHLLEVAGDISTLAAARCCLQRFQASARSRARTLFVERAQSLSVSEKVPFEGSLAPWGSYAIEGERILAHIPDDPVAAEAVLRVAYQVAVGRQGGFLLHASAVAFGEVAFLATGASGSGKSTLARLGIGAGGTLLSDEIIGVLPGGRVCGTPFRSDLEVPGTPMVARLGQVLLLEKASNEEMKSVSPGEAVGALLAQSFRPLPAGFTTPALLKFFGQLVEKPGVKRFAFRKHPDAGQYVAKWLCEANRL